MAGQGRTGRPRKDTGAARVAALAARRTGSTVEASAKAAGVSRASLLGWLAAGRAGDPNLAAWARQWDALESLPLPAASSATTEDDPAHWARVVDSAEEVNVCLARMRQFVAPIPAMGWPGGPPEWLGPDLVVSDPAAPISEQGKALARRHVLPFAVATYHGNRPWFRVNWHHALISILLTAWAFGLLRRLMIHILTRQGKTELAGRATPSFILGIDNGNKVLAGAHTGRLAKFNSRDVQNIIGSRAYQELFPATRLPNRREIMSGLHIKSALAWDLGGARGGYAGAGMDSAVGGQGAGFIPIDDCVKTREEADSPIYQATCLQRYENDWAQRSEQQDCRLFMGTKWGDLDLPGQVLTKARRELAEAEAQAREEGRQLGPEEREEDWVVANIPGLLLEETQRFPGDPRELGDPLWPDFYRRGRREWDTPPPRETLRRRAVVDLTRRAKGAGGAAMIQGRPALPGGALIKLEWCCRRWRTLPAGLDLGEWIQSWDLKAWSTSQDVRSSYVVGQVWFRPYDSGDVWLVDEFRLRCGWLDALQAMRRLSIQYPYPTRRLVEAKASGHSLATQARVPWIDAGGEQHPGLAIELVEPKGAKAARVEAVLPLWESKPPAVVLPADDCYPWMPDWIKEVTEFRGLSNHEINDRVDAMTQALAAYLEHPVVRSGLYHQAAATSRWATQGQVASQEQQWMQTGEQSAADEDAAAWRARSGRWGGL